MARAIARQRMALCVIALTVSATAVWAQGLVVSGGNKMPAFDTNQPLPVLRADAYKMVLKELGGATNRFHCVTTNSLDSKTSPGKSCGWEFVFSDKEGKKAKAEVQFWDKRVHIAAESAAMFKGEKK